MTSKTDKNELNSMTIICHYVIESFCDMKWNIQSHYITCVLSFVRSVRVEHLFNGTGKRGNILFLKIFY